jgi:SAM-dependent methyltransferase
MAEHYGPAYDRYISGAGDSSPDKWKDRVQAISPYKTGGTILDLGCSSGSFLASLKKPDWIPFGIEMSEDVAQFARKRSGAEVFVGDILQARFQEGSFDVITCFDVLEHVYEPRKVLERVYHWLKPGGIFYILVPNIESGEARLFGSYWYGLELPRHLSHFSPTSLGRLAESVGFRSASVDARRNSALEQSLSYVRKEAMNRIGLPTVPMADARDPSFPLKVIRKLLRWTVFSAMFQLTPLIGPGESVHAIFQKDLKAN